MVDHHAHDYLAAQTLPTSAPVSAGWQPIETAPEYDRVLTFERGYVEVRRHEQDHRGQCLWSGGSYGDPQPSPTHWMPLPAPPTR